MQTSFLSRPHTIFGFAAHEGVKRSKPGVPVSCACRWLARRRREFRSRAVPVPARPVVCTTSRLHVETSCACTWSRLHDQSSCACTTSFAPVRPIVCTWRLGARFCDVPKTCPSPEMPALAPFNLAARSCLAHGAVGPSALRRKFDDRFTDAASAGGKLTPTPLRAPVLSPAESSCLPERVEFRLQDSPLQLGRWPLDSGSRLLRRSS